MITRTVAILVSLVPGLCTEGLTDSQDRQGAGIKKLVRGLSDESVEARREAMVRLIGLGQVAKKAVEAANRSRDPEVARRAGAILQYWEWGIPKALAESNPYLGMQLSSKDFEQQSEAVEVLLKARTKETPEVLRRMVARGDSDPRVRRAAALGIARLGVSEPDQASGGLTKPLTNNELKALRSKPEVGIINRAVAVVGGAGRTVDRLAALAGLNELSGGELCSIKAEIRMIPLHLAAPIVKEALARWTTWWGVHCKRYGAEGEEQKPRAPSKPLTEIDVFVDAMINDPGEAVVDTKLRVVEKRVFGKDRDGKRYPRPQKVWMYTYDDKPGTGWLISRTFHDGSTLYYTYDRNGKVVVMQYSTGTTEWRLQLIDGRARRIFQDEELILEFSSH